MEEKKIAYYLIKGRMLGKREDDKDYLYGEEGWIPDVSMEIMKRLYGFDPSEPEDSPYAVGNTDIMEELEEIGCEKAEKWMAGKLLQGFMETIQDEMEADLKKIGATEIVSFGFLD